MRVKQEYKRKILVDIIREHPGLSAFELREKGYYSPRFHSLRETEQAGLIYYMNGGWNATENHCAKCGRITVLPVDICDQCAKIKINHSLGGKS